MVFRRQWVGRQEDARRQTVHQEIAMTSNSDTPEHAPQKILIVQTAFLGDLILTLPLIQRLGEALPGSRITALVIPSTAEVLLNHPAVSDHLIFDKRARDRGLRGLLNMARRLRQERFDLALVPHRSLRSALLAALSGIPRRVGFNTSTGFFLFTDTVMYHRGRHEVQRNLGLLNAIGVRAVERPARVYPGENHRRQAQAFLARHEISSRKGLIGVAPGSVWPTKRWLPEGYASVVRHLRERDGRSVVLFGGVEDRRLCLQIAQRAGQGIPVAAGELSVLSAAALMERCRVVISNDSAAAHLAAAVRCPVVVIFGPTVPEFGFVPLGDDHLVLQADVDCRPCGIHGGKACPRKTFACMRAITPEKVLQAVRSILDKNGEWPE
jgi:heptosyltransferase-2